MKVINNGPVLQVVLDSQLFTSKEAAFKQLQVSKASNKERFIVFKKVLVKMQCNVLYYNTKRVALLIVGIICSGGLGFFVFKYFEAKVNKWLIKHVRKKDTYKLVKNFDLRMINNLVVASFDRKNKQFTNLNLVPSKIWQKLKTAPLLDDKCSAEIVDKIKNVLAQGLAKAIEDQQKMDLL